MDRGWTGAVGGIFLVHRIKFADSAVEKDKIADYSVYIKLGYAKSLAMKLILIAVCDLDLKDDEITAIKDQLKALFSFNVTVPGPDEDQDPLDSVRIKMEEAILGIGGGGGGNSSLEPRVSSRLETRAPRPIDPDLASCRSTRCLRLEPRKNSKR